MGKFVKPVRYLLQQVREASLRDNVGGVQQGVVAARKLVEAMLAMSCVAFWNLLHESSLLPSMQSSGHEIGMIIAEN